MKNLIAIAFSLVCFQFVVDAQSVDVYEVRLSLGDLTSIVDEVDQAVLRAESEWGVWSNEHEGWRVVMGGGTKLPHRAWGGGIEVEGEGLEMRHAVFVQGEMSLFGVDVDQLGEARYAYKSSGAIHERAFSNQTIEGYDVLLSSLTTKWRDGKLVMWGLDWWPDAIVPEGQILSDDEILTFAINNLPMNDIESTWNGWGILPDDYAEGEYRLVRKIIIEGHIDGLLRKYSTWVDAITGQVWLRKNEVVHHVGKHATRSMGMPVTNVKYKNTKVLQESFLPIISGITQAEAHPAYPFESPEILAMPHLKMTLNGMTYYSDENGGFVTGESGDVFNVPFALEGRWSKVYTDDVMPSENIDLQDAYNYLTVPGNVKETSAYRSVNLIHDHMKLWMPEFTGLDFPMTTNIDVEGECNAFFDGGSINFFDTGGGCNPTSLIADVVYHEYGHAINSYYYNSLGAGFNNGAMGEGYADFWAMSLGDIAEIGMGFYEENNDGIRRYDENPKVYPENLVGEVHADGEIIAGAWYDTHLLMGGDWSQTISLFVDAYPGLQATAVDGNEGQAFTDVLLDVLQADDDDDDLMNGTPNAIDIIEGFAIHGITLFSYATVDHFPLLFSDADQVIEIEAEVDIIFPYNLYFDGVYLKYRTNTSDDYSEVLMDENGDVFTAELTALPPGTVVDYYMEIHDVFGGVSGVTPFAANKVSNSNLPYQIIVGCYQHLINDSDEYAELGNWQLGSPTDNASTGEWEETIPVGSFGEPGVPSTLVAPQQDHTVGFSGYCFLTGVSPGSDAGIGANDVDAGHTTLLSPVIDLTQYENPVFSYWRWYVNAPATGANPATDWWQVEISSNGGDSWQYLENTLQQDVRWRRNAFRVADYLDITDEFQMRFIASDSTTIGEYLDGGSLIEAALDDIVLYDVLPIVDNVQDASISNAVVSVSPNPASENISINGGLPNSTIRIFDLKGQVIYIGKTLQDGIITISVNDFSPGMYSAQLIDSNLRNVSIKFEILR
ncbi:MAG: T9SS type A sorting domain-containing protein [Flavobacteriales bacterium]|nr:T9SS type A sorting domain-containing protein [Flavobacteriales bacterium]